MTTSFSEIREEPLRLLDLVRVGACDGVVFRMSNFSANISPLLRLADLTEITPSPLDVRPAAEKTPGDVYLSVGSNQFSVFINNRIRYELRLNQVAMKAPTGLNEIRVLSKADSALMPGDRVMAIARIGGVKVGHMGEVVRTFGNYPQVCFDGVPGRPSITRTEKLSAPLNRVFDILNSQIRDFRKFEVGQRVSFKLSRWGVDDVFLTGTVLQQLPSGELRISPENPAYRDLWLNNSDAYPTGIVFVLMPDGTEKEYCQPAQAVDHARKKSLRLTSTVQVVTKSVIAQFNGGVKLK